MRLDLNSQVVLHKIFKTAFVIPTTLILTIVLYIVRMGLPIFALIAGVGLAPFLSAFVAFLPIFGIVLITFAMVFSAPSSLTLSRETDLLKRMVNRRSE